ncbi:MAG TPA: DinB family protein [Candidatus Krumholzibacteria bacterium]
MSRPSEIERFREVWNAEAGYTVRLMEGLPVDQYDYRPDPGGRSIGELAWHLSEIDACLTYGISIGRFRLEDEPPNLKRPREVPLLAPGYRRIHEEAVARIKELTDADLEREMTYFDGGTHTVRHILWEYLLHHLIHHRAQLVLMCRMAGGRPPGFYGPNREEMRAIQEKMRAKPAAG